MPPKSFKKGYQTAIKTGNVRLFCSLYDFDKGHSRGDLLWLFREYSGSKSAAWLDCLTAIAKKINLSKKISFDKHVWKIVLTKITVQEIVAMEAFKLGTCYDLVQDLSKVNNSTMQSFAQEHKGGIGYLKFLAKNGLATPAKAISLVNECKISDLTDLVKLCVELSLCSYEDLAKLINKFTDPELVQTILDNVKVLWWNRFIKSTDWESAECLGVFIKHIRIVPDRLFRVLPTLSHDHIRAIVKNTSWPHGLLKPARLHPPVMKIMVQLGIVPWDMSIQQALELSEGSITTVVGIRNSRGNDAIILDESHYQYITDTDVLPKVLCGMVFEYSVE